MINNQLKAIELFAGIGGFRLGMENANIETIWANDLSKLSCQVYESNFGKGSNICTLLVMLQVELIFLI